MTLLANSDFPHLSLQFALFLCFLGGPLQSAHYQRRLFEFIPIKPVATTGSYAPAIMQGTAEFHHQIAEVLFTEADPVFDNATALHTAVDLLDPQSAAGKLLIDRLLLPRQVLGVGKELCNIPDKPWEGQQLVETNDIVHLDFCISSCTIFQRFGRGFSPSGRV